MANSKVNILGTDYEIAVKKYGEDEAFERRSIDGYCDHLLKQIVICDMTTYKGWENEPVETAKEAQKQTLRHEIVHALSFEGAWCKNEELVDWIAWQGTKIHKAWEQSGAV